MFFIEYERPLSAKSRHLRSLRESDDCGSFAGIIRDPKLPYSMMLTG